jgi:hypothetical protein
MLLGETKATDHEEAKGLSWLTVRPNDQPL